MNSRYALVIANTEYQDASFAKLTAPGKDAEEFAQVLREQAMFDGVQVLLNEGEGRTRRSIARFFAERKHDDLLLLYFSGHGVRDEQGRLFLAVNDTELAILDASGIPAEFVTTAMNNSRSQRQLLILDCCNSGAFAHGSKSASGLGRSMGIATAFEGSGFGRVILTATDATQYAWEGDKVTGETQKSLFTHFLIEGLKGDADQNGDGCIDVDELYDFAYEQVVRTTPKQTPGKWSYKQQGDIILRDNLTPRDVKPVPLPVEVLELLSHPSSGVRKAGIQDLIALMQGSHPGLARAAEEKLREIAEKDDSLTIRRTARDELMARGVVLDKDTTERFSKEYLEARKAAEMEARKKTVPKEEPRVHDVGVREGIPTLYPAVNRKGPTSKSALRLIGGVGAGLLILIIILWLGSLTNFFPLSFDRSATPTQTPTWLRATETSKPTATRTFTPVSTKTSKITITSIPPVLKSPTSTPEPTLGIGSTMISDKDGMVLMYVPAGTFVMGSDGGDKNVRPTHKVDLDAYWIDQTEVTNAMYAKCVNDQGACNPPAHSYDSRHKPYFGDTTHGKYPVVYVSWNSAKDYCEWADRRLPTEAEWEKAARGTDGRNYPWGSNLPTKERLNYSNYVGHTTEVGIYPLGASPYGAWDMAGNVLEWVSSIYRPYPYVSTDGREDLSSSSMRVVRGGAWFDRENNVQSFARYKYSSSFDFIGFRCAMSATP